MTTRRRYLTFSLRTIFVLTTAFAVWLGIVVTQAREQRMIVEKIESVGGEVVLGLRATVRPEPISPMQIKARNKIAKVIGYDYVARVDYVFFDDVPVPTDSEILELVPDLTRLRGLTNVILPASVSAETRSRIEAALPDCTVK